MKTIIKILLTTALTINVAACQPKKSNPMTEQEKQTVAAITQTLKPVCLGRYLVDIPTAYIAKSGLDIRKYKGDKYPITIEAIAMSQADFMKNIADIISKYRATKFRPNPTTPYLINVNSINPDQVVIERLESELEGNGVLRYVEAYKYINGYRIKLGVNARDATDEKFKNEDAVYRTTNVPEKKAQIEALMERVRGRRDDEIPTEAGTCFNGGFLAGKAGEDERIDGSFQNIKYPDFVFDFSVNSNLANGDTILDRKNDIIKYLGSEGKLLRIGDVKLAGIAQASEYILEHKMTGTNATGQECSLETNSRKATPDTPFINLEMFNGIGTERTQGITKASFSQAEAIAIWDIVSRTLRPRPGAF